MRMLGECALDDADLWWIRFGLDLDQRVLACGNRTGGVRVYDIHASPPQLLAQMQLRRAPQTGAAVKAKARAVAADVLPVRQCAPSADGRMLLACAEDGSVWRWDWRVPPLEAGLEAQRAVAAGDGGPGPSAGPGGGT